MVVRLYLAAKEARDCGEMDTTMVLVVNVVGSMFVFVLLEIVL